MRIFIFLLIFVLFSCKSKNLIVVAQLNTIGKVIKIETCKNCLDGNFIYTLELDITERQKIKYITDYTYKVGDMIYFQTIIRKDTYE